MSEATSSALPALFGDYGPPAAGAASPAEKRMSRIDSVDLLRGIVMVIMLLDHTRDFVHSQALQFDPADMTRTYPALFFTRWITHFCAPIFVFLAGTGSYFQLMRGKSKRELSRFLVTRGVWLIFLELTAVRIASFWTFSFQFLGVMQVIWALGWSMIALGILIYLRVRYIAAFGIGMIALHNLTDTIRVAPWNGPESPVPSVLAKLWMTLHQGGAFPIAGWPSPVIVMFYPLIPWIGVMAAGFAFGKVYELESEERRRWMLRWGTAITLGFALLRLADFYGDPNGWGVQASGAMTIVSFLNTTKYPPSLLYLMMTLGPAIIALSYWEPLNQPGKDQHAVLTRALITYGRVPLFYYLLQWIVAHGAGYVLAAAAHKQTAIFFSDAQPSALPRDIGFDLWVVYACWIAGVLMLYPLCRWYAGVKARRRDWWLSYL
jgi:uncharacterized membrane protein